MSEQPGVGEEQDGSVSQVVHEGQENDVSEELLKERRVRADLEARIKYLQADYQNLIKRSAREIEEYSRVANERSARHFIELEETVEAALGMVRGKADPSVVEGLELILKKIEEIMKAEGLSKIESVGQKFDPYYHEAASMVESDLPEGTVVEEIRSGYTLNGRVIRPSVVKVSKHMVRTENA
ncbi:MAG: nucleotide exchange factor GrpE [Candidatus Marsarchaeota archaeon]|nr:nucleotide exchange factor GrpE [Candidatus Marsarchaeota archaeon]